MSTTHDHFRTRMKETLHNLRNAEAEARALRGENKRLRDALQDTQWQPIDTAPRGKNIMMMPICGIPFSGDIWNCKNRIDIEEDELIRIRCPGGHICSLPITWATHWQDLPSRDSLLPKPPTKENEQ